MKYVIVILPMVLACLNSLAIKLEQLPMDKINFDLESPVRTYRDWIITKIPNKNKNSVTDYRLDIKVSNMDRKKFNLYNFLFTGDPAAPYIDKKTYKADNFLPSFIFPRAVPLTKERLAEISTLSNTVHWIEWRSGNQKSHLKASLRLPNTDVSSQLFERILADYGQEIPTSSLRTGDVIVVFGTDDIDKIDQPVASYIYIGNGVVLESKKATGGGFSKFVYLKDIQTHFKNRLVDARLRTYKILMKKPLYLSEFLKDSSLPDLNLDRQAYKSTEEIL